MSRTYVYLRWRGAYREDFVLEVIVMCNKVTTKVTTHVDGTKSVIATPVLLISGDRDTYAEGVKYSPDNYSENNGWAITLMEPL